MASEKHLALLKKAENSIGWKQYKQALKAYDEAIKIKSNCIEAWEGKGKVYLELKEWDKAIVAFDKMIKLQPTSFGGYLNKAAALEEAGQEADAEEVYRSAIDRVTDTNLAEFLLGAYLNRQKRFAESIVYLDAAVGKGNEPMILMARAFALENLERYEEALSDVNRIMAMGDFFMVYHTKGQLLEKMGRDEDALAVYSAGMNTDPNPMLLLDKAYILEKLGRSEEAQLIYDLEEKFGEGIGQPWRAIDLQAQIQTRLDNLDRAIELHQQIIDQYPDNEDSHYEQGICYVRQGNLDRGLELVLKAIDLNENFLDYARTEPMLEPIHDQLPISSAPASPSIQPQ